MEADTGNSSESFLPPALERSLPDDAAEYMLFVVDDAQTTSTTPAGSAAIKPRTRLDQVRKATLKLVEDLTRNYIWQRDSFNLEIVSRNSLLYLRGVTSYGDCVEDEWLIVYILREISKQFADVWARIGDSDGEFLLVEAAKAVPRWLNPEMDANRIWIHGGKLLVIPLEAQVSSKPSLELAEVVQIIKTAPGSLVHIPALEKEAFHRLRKYPGHITASIYHTRLILPRKIAHVLHDRPRAIAPAVEAFVARDPISTKKVFGTTNTPANTETDDKASIPTTHQLQFPPTDFAVVSVKFTRVLYAQLRGQRFTPPNGWPSAYGTFCEENFLSSKGKGKAADTDDKKPDMEKLQAMLEVSMKLACGFELMASTADTSNNRIVREVALVLEDIAEDESELPTDQDVRQWKDVDREDDDAWLNIDFDDFERELDSGRKEEPTVTQNEGSSSTPEQAASTKTGAGFGDAGVQTDLRRIVSQFQAFLNDNDAGIEGAEFDEMDEDDDEDEYEDDEDDSDDGGGVNFDEDEFNRLMRDMMGLPPAEGTALMAAKEEPKTTPKVVATATKAKSAKPNGAEDDDMESILNLAAQFEAELKGHGALKLNPSKAKVSAITDGKGSGSRAVSQSNGHDDEDEDDDDDEVDVDFNLAKNLLESFKGQEGMAGPAGNILSMLGMALPRDKDDDEDED